MKESEKKLKYTLARAELGHYLRQMAKALEGADIQDYGDLKGGLSGFSKIDLKIKSNQAAVDVKLKVKTAVMPQEGVADVDKGAADDAKPKYKTLKKRMKSSFKAIGQSLSTDQLPEALTVKEFLADSELMISYPGYGDEYYAAYREALVDFAQAFEKRDQVSVQQSYARLEQLKDECHDRYK